MVEGLLRDFQGLMGGVMIRGFGFIDQGNSVLYFPHKPIGTRNNFQRDHQINPMQPLCNPIYLCELLGKLCLVSGTLVPLST